jgi:cytochrome c556
MEFAARAHARRAAGFVVTQGERFMKRLVCAAAGLVLVAAGVAVAADPTIKDIMIKAHKPGKSLLANIMGELKEDEPDWSDVQKDSKELVELGTALGKNTPPKGDQASWDRLTKAYLANVQSLEAAAESKNKSAAQTALKQMQGSCRACHMAHRPPQ